MVKALFNAGQKNVIVNECHITQDTRDFWVSPEWEIECIFIPAREDVCIKRAKERRGQKSIPEIKSLAANWNAEAQYQNDVAMNEVCSYRVKNKN